MPYELKKMKESLEKNKKELEKIAKKSSKENKFDAVKNSLTTTLLVEAVSNLHMIIEIENEKMTETQSESKQDIAKRKKEQELILENLENEKIENEIVDVLKSYPEKFRGIVKLIIEQIKFNYSESYKELKRIYSLTSECEIRTEMKSLSI